MKAIQLERQEVGKWMTKLRRFLANRSKADESAGQRSNLTNHHDEDFYEVSFDYNSFQTCNTCSGDIALTLDQAKYLYDYHVNKDKRRKKRKFFDMRVHKWDVDRPIEYTFDGSH
uniref:PH domain-containing protein n=1 Tax=Romanomermis culicivorax TaxID=13658 RepID=A0A915I6A6_ROMCU